jgi:hypothetical protein
MAMTSLFKSYCQQKANKIDGVKNKHTLELLSEYEDNTFTTNHSLSNSFQKTWDMGNMPTIILDKPIRTQGDGGNPTTKQQQKIRKATSTTAYHATTKPNEKEDGVLPTTKADKIEDDVVHEEHHEDPLFEETKSKKLRTWLLRLRKVLDENKTDKNLKGDFFVLAKKKTSTGQTALKKRVVLR